jgi:hypothetical protein
MFPMVKRKLSAGRTSPSLDAGELRPICRTVPRPRVPRVSRARLKFLIVSK